MSITPVIPSEPAESSDANAVTRRPAALPLQSLGVGRDIASMPAPTPAPALATDDDFQFSSDSWDDDGGGDGLLQLTGFAPEEAAAPARQRDERYRFAQMPQQQRAPRLDDVYRLAQERRQADSDLDWALRLLGQRPQPQEAPTAQPAQQPGAAPQQPRRTVRRLQRDAEGNIIGIEEAEEAVAPPAAAPAPVEPAAGRGVVAEVPWWLTEALGGTGRGIISTGGSTLQVPDVAAAAVELEQQRRRHRMLDFADLIDQSGAPGPFRPGEVRDPVLSGFVARYESMTPEERQAERARLDQEILSNVPMAIAERSLFRAGVRIKEFAREFIPHVEGYDDDSWAAMIGSGLGSVIAGIPVSVAMGPAGSGVFFAGIGLSEATERAVAFDRKEKAEGRPGLTDEQIAFAGIMGIAPGATDAAPVEVLLGRLKIPGMTPTIQSALARAIVKHGGAALMQAGIEGLQEGAQQALQNAIAQGYDPTQSLTQDVLKSIALGLAVGFGARGAMSPFIASAEARERQAVGGIAGGIHKEMQR
jgi:hypothetical protein